MIEYPEDDMLMLSGIQHFAFCPRQWALIHIDQLWDDNRLTVEGHILHKNVDNSFYRQKSGDIICLRSVNIASKELGLYGLSDVVELHATDKAIDSITHPKYPGFWIPYPIEYKRGKPKRNNIDAVQLAAQAMCLEEQYGIHISEGALYYGEIRHREIVVFDEALRKEVRELASEMHKVYDSRKIPKSELKAYCKSCSLKGVCMPETSCSLSASNYLKRNLYEEIT